MEIFFGVVVVCSVVIATTAVVCVIVCSAGYVAINRNFCLQDLPGLPPINATGQGSGGVRVDGPGPLDASGRIGGGGGLHVDDDDARLGGSGGGQVGLPPVPAIPVQVSRQGTYFELASVQVSCEV